MSESKRPRPLSQELAKAEPPQWVREATEHYHQTGSYRVEDLARVMGDQTQGVSVSGPDTDVSGWGDPQNVTISDDPKPGQSS